MYKKTIISVVGGSDVSKEEANIAEEVGREIALKGAVLLCGGMGGVMLNAAKGAKEAGGLTVGILPGSLAEEANPYIDIPIVTGLGHARNVIVAQSGNAVIAIGGKLGTLTEISFALMQGKNVIGINSWELNERRTYGNNMIVANSAKDAVNKAFRFIDTVRN